MNVLKSDLSLRAAFRGAVVLCIGLVLAGWAQAQDNYWTGVAADGYWTNAANWSLEVVPTEAHRVIFADNPPADQTQTIRLTEDVTIQRILFEATGGRHYVLEAENEATLLLTFASRAIDMDSAATANLTLDLFVYAGIQEDNPTAYIYHSSTNSLLTIGPNGVYRPATDYRLYGTGTVVLEGRIATRDGTREFHWYGDNTIIIATTNNPAIEAYFFPRSSGPGGTVYLKEDLNFGGNRWRGAGQVFLGTYGEDSPDRLVTSPGPIRFNRSGNLTIIENPIDGSGNVTIQVSHWENASTWAAGEIITIPGATVEIGRGSRYMHGGPHPGVSGGGNLHMLADLATHVFTMRRAVTHSGRTLLERGILRMDEGAYEHAGIPGVSHGLLSPDSVVELGAEAVWDLNGVDQVIPGLRGFRGKALNQDETFGEVRLGGATLTVDAQTATAFAGTIGGTGALVKAGVETFTLMGGYTNAADRVLRVAGGLLEVTGALDIEQGSFEIAGGRIAAGTLAAGGMTWDVTLAAGQEDEGYYLVSADSAVITDGQLVLRLAEGFEPELETQFTLLRVAGTITGDAGGRWFGFEDGAEIVGTDGSLFRLNFSGGSEQLVLTVIPEPGSLALLALALLGLAAQRLRRGRFFRGA